MHHMHHMHIHALHRMLSSLALSCSTFSLEYLRMLICAVVHCMLTCAVLHHMLTCAVVHRLLTCAVVHRIFTCVIVHRTHSSLAQSLRHFIGFCADVDVVSPGPFNGDELIYDRNSRISSVGRMGVRQIRHKLTTGDGNCAFPALLECERERACDSAFDS